MPARRLLVRKIREVLRLKHEHGLSHRAIARACAVGVGTVTLYLQRTVQEGLGWPLPAELDDAALEARLFRREAPVHDRVRPDCAYIHRELKRDGVTLQLLWEEYAQVHPNGYRRTQFCEIYRQWARRLRPSMRQVHRAGEKTFIDFSGKRPALVDPRTGEVRRVELFVTVLGASSLTYAEATATQQLPDWVDAHVRMVEYFDGTTALWVPDQLRSAITRPCRYEPGVSRTYEDLAAHYGAVVVPARPRKPKDKAAAEAAVLLAVNGRRKVTYSRQPSVRSSPASDLFLVIDGEEDAGCGRCGKPRSSRFSKLPVGALFASMGSVGVHGPGVGRQRCVRVA